MYKTYKKDANIFIVYIKEAHPEDGWKSRGNALAGIKVNQPKTYEERVKVAGSCMKDLKMTIPCLVDDMKNTAQKAYAGWPDRLYVIDKEGKVSFKGDRGPRGFKPSDAEKALKKALGR